jgi:two-component system NarL family sensor kinase
MADRRRAERRRPTADALAAADRQRRRFAQQLHDDTIQTLLSALQDLEQAKGELAEAPESAAAAVQRSIELLAGSVRQLRERATDYDPNPPIGLPLADALQLLADQAASRGNFTCAVHVAPGPVGADERLILATVRELLANAAKHARATHVAVNLSSSPAGGARIVVSDDGIGVTPEEIRDAFGSGHIGLPLIAARVEEQGGMFSIDGRVGQGTKATIVLPAPNG